MILEGSKVFERKKGDKYPHEVNLSEKYEALLAAVMIHDHREATNAVERALEVAVSSYPTKKREELLEIVGKLKSGELKPNEI